MHANNGHLSIWSNERRVFRAEPDEAEEQVKAVESKRRVNVRRCVQRMIANSDEEGREREKAETSGQHGQTHMSIGT